VHDPAAVEAPLGRATDVWERFHALWRPDARCRASRGRLRAAGCFVVEDAAHALRPRCAIPTPAGGSASGAPRRGLLLVLREQDSRRARAAWRATAARRSRKPSDLSLHGMSHDAWGALPRRRELGLCDHGRRLQVQHDGSRGRLGLGSSPGPTLRSRRAAIALRYTAELDDLRSRDSREQADVGTPGPLPDPAPPRPLTINRDEFFACSRPRCRTSVHWRPLHMQPY